MDDNVFLRIEHKYPALSKTHRSIANYIRAHSIAVTYLSISELSAAAKVSLGSITGFCKAIDYSGYPALQKELQRWATQEVFPMREIKNSISSGSEDEDILKTVIDLNIQNLQFTYTEALSAGYWQAVESLRRGRRIYIIGLRSCHAVAYYLYFMLSDFMDNVTLLSLGEGDVYDRIMGVSAEDVLVTIGFDKYTRATCEITEFFREKGGSIIALTDHLGSPLALLSDTALIATNSSTTFSYVSAMTILNAVIIGVGRRAQTNTLKKIEERQTLLRERGVHYLPKH